MLAQMLAPAAVLVLWTLFMVAWVAVTRFSAFKNVGLDLSAAPPGGRYQEREDQMPDKVNWKSHNHTHLMEQPTVFYPTVIILAMTGAGSWDVLLAWVYVSLRVAHSLWQSLVNTIPVRFALFFVSTFVLIALAIRAVMATVFADPSLAPQ